MKPWIFILLLVFVLRWEARIPVQSDEHCRVTNFRSPASGDELLCDILDPTISEIKKIIFKEGERIPPTPESPFTYLAPLLREGKVKDSDLGFQLSQFVDDKMKLELKHSQIALVADWKALIYSRPFSIYKLSTPMELISRKGNPEIYTFVSNGTLKTFEPLSETNFHFARKSYLSSQLDQELGTEMIQKAEIATVDGENGVVRDFIKGREYFASDMSEEERRRIGDVQALAFLMGHQNLTENELIFDNSGKMWIALNQKAWATDLSETNALTMFGRDVPTSVTKEVYTKLKNLDLDKFTEQLTPRKRDPFEFVTKFS